MQKVFDEIRALNIKLLYKREDVYPYAFDTAPIKDEVVLPLCVVFPKNTKDVQNIVKLAKKYGLNVIPRGAATCHTSGCKPNNKSIVIHLSFMDKILL